MWTFSKDSKDFLRMNLFLRTSLLGAHTETIHPLKLLGILQQDYPITEYCTLKLRGSHSNTLKMHIISRLLERSWAQLSIQTSSLFYKYLLNDRHCFDHLESNNTMKQHNEIFKIYTLQAMADKFENVSRTVGMHAPIRGTGMTRWRTPVGRPAEKSHSRKSKCKHQVQNAWGRSNFLGTTRWPTRYQTYNIK